jgi:hypothetical protein
LKRDSFSGFFISLPFDFQPIKPPFQKSLFFFLKRDKVEHAIQSRIPNQENLMNMKQPGKPQPAPTNKAPEKKPQPAPAPQPNKKGPGK